jgi:FkbM family methyltransferase
MNLKNLPWIELEDKQAAYQVIKFLPNNPVILEAGACDAEDTLKFKDIWSKSIIYCFEPNPDLFEIATRNIEKPPSTFSKSKNNSDIHLSPLALADYVGEKSFYMSSTMPAASSFYVDNTANLEIPQTVLDSLKIKREEFSSYKDKAITVQCTTIDIWKKEKIDFIWLDTEGAELIILKGAVNTLPEVKVIYVEFNFQEFRKDMAQFEEVYDFLVSHNFKLYVIWQAHENWQANGVFVRKDLYE